MVSGNNSSNRLVTRIFEAHNLEMKITSLLVLLLFFGQSSAHDMLEWPACSKTCGGGTRTLNIPGFSPYTTRCSTHPCPSKPGNLITYTRCSQKCGGGYRVRSAPCSNGNKFVKCKTYEECNTHECPTRDSCPSNHKFRFESKSSCCAKSKDACGVPKEMTKTQQNVIGGKMSAVGEWPWMAAIIYRTSWSLRCGGSLIHKDWILTAAHCIHILNKNHFYVLLGSTSIKYPKSTRQVIEIEKFIPHEDFSDPLNDIGLVKMKTSAKLNDYVKPICLPNGESVKIDKTCVAAGWGVARKEDIKNVITSNVLKHIFLRNLPKDACVLGLRPSFQLKYYSEKRNLCFGILSGNKSSCKGDSGGPIMCQRCSSCGWYVAGITSYGPKKCGAKGLPSVYTYVKNNEDWIKKKVKGLSSKKFSC